MGERRYFGTDGIRGKANHTPMTPEIAMRVGMAAGSYFKATSKRSTVVIAKDTRLSGYMLEPALAAGFTSVGMDVVMVGPLPTPAVALLVRSFRANLGVMISASHNPYDDNGIKLFGPDGYKLTDAQELEIEARMDMSAEKFAAESDKLGRAKRLEDARGRYIEYAKATLPRGLRLDGLKVVLDCANGAAYQVAPEVLWELGAEVITIGNRPNGFNINAECGSTHPAQMQEEVRKHRADIGLALDGDADRLILCDECGELIDGDQLMAMVATALHSRGSLSGGAVVATVMSNMGLERYLNGLGLALHRTKVGDRYVIEEMRSKECNVGGEQSGHIILSDFSTTGDGTLAALQVLAMLQEQQKPASEACRLFKPMPQKLVNVRYGDVMPLELSEVKASIAEAEAELKQKGGRLLVRKSGTEPLIRLMAEAEDEEVIESVLNRLKNATETAMTESSLLATNSSAAL